MMSELVLFQPRSKPSIKVARAASMAAATTLSFSVTSGGIICIIAVALCALLIPEFRKFDIRTSKYALENQKMAEKLRVNPDSEEQKP